MSKNIFFQFFEIFKKKLSPDPLYQGDIGSKSFFSIFFFAFRDHFKPFWATTKKKLKIFKKILSPAPFTKGSYGQKIFFSIFMCFLHPGTILSHFEQNNFFSIFLGLTLSLPCVFSDPKFPSGGVILTQHWKTSF